MPRGLLGPDTFTTATPGPARQSPDLGTVLTLTAVVTGTGTVGATVLIEGGHDGLYWFPVGSALVISSGASPQSGTITRNPYSFAQYRINCTAISGTAAQCVAALSVGG